MPGTFSVPDRRPRSCPPPQMSGASSVRLRTNSAPQPFGPYILWPVSESRSMPIALTSIGILPDRLRRVGVEQRAMRVRDRGRSRSSGCSTPISLLAAITLTMRRRRRHHRRERVEIDEAVRDRRARSRPAIRRGPSRLRRFEHRLVLDGRHHDVPAIGGRRVGDAADGEVVRLGGAAREDDLARRSRR